MLNKTENQTPNSGFLNFSPWLHIGIIQYADSPEQANRLLLEHYCRNKIWKAAKLILNKPMDKPVDTDWLNAIPDDWAMSLSFSSL